MADSVRLSGQQWTIASDGHEAVVVEVGGGLRTYRVGGLDIVDGYADNELPPGCAGQVLAPWPNRIRDGRYSFNGAAQQLPLTEPPLHNAVHGLTRWVPWQRVGAAADELTVECRLAAQTGYPWPLLLRTTWHVGGDGLTVTHEAINEGDVACPFGLGVHPYLRFPGIAVDDLVLRVPARSRLLVDGRLLPIGVARVASTEYDFTSLRRIGPTSLDTAFGDLERGEDGGSSVVLGDAHGRRIEVWADHTFHWWQVYTSDTLPGERRRRSVAVEPMTCPPDAFRSGRDLVTLEPGVAWRGSWGIRTVPAGADA